MDFPVESYSFLPGSRAILDLSYRSRLRNSNYTMSQQSRPTISMSLTHSRRNAVRHVNCLHNARFITKSLGTRQLESCYHCGLPCLITPFECIFLYMINDHKDERSRIKNHIDFHVKLINSPIDAAVGCNKYATSEIL